MPQHDPAKERYWRRLLWQWRKSGMTVRQFCSEHAASEPSFYSWRRTIEQRDRLRKAATREPASGKTSAQPKPSKDADPVFIPVAIDTNVTTPTAVELVVSQRHVLRVRPGFDVDVLRQLLRLLEEPPC